MNSKSYLFGLGVLLAGCGGSGPEATVSPLEFVPNPVTVAGGTCSATARVTSLSGNAVTLVTLSALITETEGDQQSEVEYNSEELATQLGTVALPGYSTLEGPISFDLSGEGITPPAEIAVVILGVGAAGTTQFVGGLLCEAP